MRASNTETSKGAIVAAPTFPIPPSAGRRWGQLCVLAVALTLGGVVSVPAVAKGKSSTAAKPASKPAGKSAATAAKPGKGGKAATGKASG